MSKENKRIDRIITGLQEQIQQLKAENSRIIENHCQDIVKHEKELAEKDKRIAELKEENKKIKDEIKELEIGKKVNWE